MFGLGSVFSILAVSFAAVKAIPAHNAAGSGLVTRAFPPTSDFTDTWWFWTTTSAVSGVPPGSSAFRLTFQPDTSLPVANISVAISADNAYNLYFNGTLIGSALDWQTPNIWNISNVPSNTPWVFSILATNYAVSSTDTGINPAGVIASFVASSTPLQRAYTFFLGQNGVVWKGTDSVPENFFSPTLDDSAWPFAFTEVPYGGGPWGILPAPVHSHL
ncbi:hypothetical protein R3P38DRAFT_3245389 [Favolaschia claudopus]|uniref:Glycoside hydrolase family 78 protein n=1 Tax=Favolaschia claudopus TaxID=2862362 RepID=A0AAV9Z0L6_9AGAR